MAELRDLATDELRRAVETVRQWPNGTTLSVNEALIYRQAWDHYRDIATPDRILGLLDERDRLLNVVEELAELAEDRTATDPDDEWHRGFHEASSRVRAALRGSGAANEEARDG